MSDFEFPPRAEVMGPPSRESWAAKCTAETIKSREFDRDTAEMLTRLACEAKAGLPALLPAHLRTEPETVDLTVAGPVIGVALLIAVAAWLGYHFGKSSRRPN
jgi:hypothetical protein